MDTPEKKLVGKVCPECGASMATLDPYGHMLTHYPEFLEPAKSSKNARRNQKEILEGGVSVETYNKRLKEEV